MPDACAGLRELLEFPAIVSFKIIVDARAPAALAGLVALIESIDRDALKEREFPGRASRNGRYLSYTVPVRVASAELLETYYREISGLEYVKHII